MLRNEGIRGQAFGAGTSTISPLSKVASVGSGRVDTSMGIAPTLTTAGMSPCSDNMHSKCFVNPWTLELIEDVLSTPVRPSLESVIAFGGIPKEAAIEVRSSARLGGRPDADSTQMEKTMKNASVRDMSSYSGINPRPRSILDIPDHEIANKAGDR